MNILWCKHFKLTLVYSSLSILMSSAWILATDCSAAPIEPTWGSVLASRQTHKAKQKFKDTPSWGDISVAASAQLQLLQVHSVSCFCCCG